MPENNTQNSDQTPATPEFRGPGSVYARLLYETLGLLAHTAGVAVEAQYQATHDKLTGLLEKNAWKEKIAQRIEENRTAEKPFGVIFLDLNKFKSVNDTLGHEIGDELLKAFANFLNTSVLKRTSDAATHERRYEDTESSSEDRTGGRYGGDEFGILCDLSPRTDDASRTPKDRVESIGAKLREGFDAFLSNLEQYDELKSHAPRIREADFGLAIGCAVWEPGMSVSTLLKKADEAMYANKNKS